MELVPEEVAESRRSRSALMDAIVQERYGSPEVLEVRRVPVPTPGAGEVLVRVAASSLNVYDIHMTTGLPYMARMVAGVRRPKNPIPGADVAGTVVEIGAGVTRFEVGDEVFGEVGAGAFAEYVVAGEQLLARKPSGTTFEQAAAVPLAALTALQGLRDVGGIESGQAVTINGASGGVGTFAVQIAKAFEAEVTAVCSTGKVDMARSIGADRVVDYTQADFTAIVRDQDILFDNAGNRPWSQTRRVLAPGGKNVTVTGPKHRWLGPVRSFVVRKLASSVDSRSFTWFTAQVKTEDLDHLATLLGSEAIRPVVERSYGLADIPDALRHLGEGHALGKLVVVH